MSTSRRDVEELKRLQREAAELRSKRKGRRSTANDVWSEGNCHAK